ncbi:MAG: 30S ribosomal protein S8 [Ignavibacteriales bacterium]|nr:30S ribosomal protein S8 [Ignavibacteriales bacterium]MCF8315690.1 30S ribosomal protein S8 [Ignavibacteriales bacterium]MCF8437116.1 30S ribosomal protein S8 [Ignavibacteriales bacterium]
MSMSDPISDFLTRMRNAIKARKRFVNIPSSNAKIKIAEILKDKNFIKDFEVIQDNKQNILKVYLKYVDGVSSISGMKKISTPGRRLYVANTELPRVLNGLGVAIISTSNGMMTDKDARAQAVGGEVICHIW